jgi:CDP-paratose 2-epimerase
MKVLVTGATGLVGQNSTAYFLSLGHDVIGIDNNSRKNFFNTETPASINHHNFHFYNYDIRDTKKVEELFKNYRFDAIIHCAGQPSHDYSAQHPLEDFDINARGTLLLLELARLNCPESPFIFVSSNKVYGDRPNSLDIEENETRFYFENKYHLGIDETLPIDQSLHSPFGVSKASADLLTQEYGRYYGLPTACFRASCITGPFHQGVSLHGFLSYIIACFAKNTHYTVYGHKGKQVRDQLHAMDLANAFNLFIQKPRIGEVYNIGGGLENSASIIEIINALEKKANKKISFEFSDIARKGDHICYYTDNSKFKKDFPNWKIEHSLDSIINQILLSDHQFNKL